ncbi:MULTISPECIES: MFS transporter [unclassified Bacillus (in: firmicutes)]|uniref:MFS transporter n=1 Tax=unclassified Bacillus (in: firmicutes) TaxID=185979 RepID=UPI000BF19B3C|nr:MULTISPECIES: MFS transporter [unclassified Bacillus (in: firmicutes)]PEJ59620.1 MFS transporter [Bacillus sp. AFS002410]PEL05839.1 MFS transporter [Bacillus sp. AFS017336]
MLKSQKRWFLIALPIFFFWFFGQIDKVGISVIQTDPGFLKALGMTGIDKNAKIGLLSFVFTIAYGISNLFWGFIIDKFGARKTAIAGLFVWSLTMFSSGLSTTYEAFIISRIILGFSEGMMIPVSGKFISAWFNKRELGRAQASWLTGNYLGPAIGAVILVLVISSLHWHAAFFILAGFNLVINIPMFIFLTRNTPEEHQWVSNEELALIRRPVDFEEQEKGSNENKNFIQDYRFWIVWFGMLVCSFLFFGISIWLPTYLIEAKGFAREGMTSITSLSWLFALGFVLLCGFLADKTRRPSLMAAILFSLTVIFLTTAVFVPNAIIAGVCMGLAMGCQGGVFHLSNMFLVKYSTQETAGRAAGLIGFTNLMGGFSSYIMGWLRDSSGGSFTTSIFMLIITALLGLIAYSFSIKEEATELRAVPLPPQKINA